MIYIKSKIRDITRKHLLVQFLKCTWTYHSVPSSQFISSNLYPFHNRFMQLPKHGDDRQVPVLPNTAIEHFTVIVNKHITVNKCPKCSPCPLCFGFCYEPLMAFRSNLFKRIRFNKTDTQKYGDCKTKIIPLSSCSCGD